MPVVRLTDLTEFAFSLASATCYCSLPLEGLSPSIPRRYVVDHIIMHNAYSIFTKTGILANYLASISTPAGKSNLRNSSIVC